jgi:adenine-specific DNA glycosylase
MLINKAIILNDILEQPDEYRKHFPTAIAEIDQVVKKPRCGICITAFFKKMLSIQNFHQQMTIIMKESSLEFAQDVQEFSYSTETKNPIKSKTKVEVFFINVEDSKMFIEKYTEGKLIRNIQTLYVPSKVENASDKIMVTINWSTL